MPRPDHTDDELPEFPYDEGNPDSSLPDEDAQQPAASGRDDLHHAKAQLDDDGPTVGEAAKSIAKSADLNTDAIQSLVSAVEQLASSLPGTTPSQSTTLATPSPATPADETPSKTPPLDLSRVTAGLDRIYSAIVDGKSSSAAPSASPAPSAASPSASPAPFVSPNLVPGQKSGVDKVPAALTEGEYVMRPEAVKTHGLDFMEEINAAKAPAASEPVKGHSIGGFIAGAASKAGKAVVGAAKATKSAYSGVMGAADSAESAVKSGLKTAAPYVASEQDTQSIVTGGEAGGGFYNSYKEATRSAQAPQNAPSIGNSAASAAVSGALTGGPLAGAVAGVVAGFKAVGESANAASKNLESYSAEIATANAEANVAQITGDMDRASAVGEDVARHTNVTSDISQSNQNLEAGLMKAGLAIMNPLLELIEPLIGFVNQVLGGMAAEALKYLAYIGECIGKMLECWPFSQQGTEAQMKKFGDDLRKAAKGIEDLVDTAKKDDDEGGLDIDQFMNQFLQGHGMGDDQDQHKFSAVRNVGPKKKPKSKKDWNAAGGAFG